MEVKAKMDAGVPYTYRFKVPKGKVRRGVFDLRRTNDLLRIVPYTAGLQLLSLGDASALGDLFVCVSRLRIGFTAWASVATLWNFLRFAC